MIWTLLYLVVVFLGLSLWAVRRRDREYTALNQVLAARQEARALGSHRAELQYPHVDLDLCIGCGACVKACPEQGVLGLAHGQAVVIHGARCVGHAVCAAVCPTGGIQVRLGDLDDRDDIPVIKESLEVVGVPGLYLAGEVTGYALIRTAVAHGTAAARHVARALAERAHEHGASSRYGGPETWDLVIVGAGPAGLSCALAAKEAGINALVIEQSSLGGTVSKYPRRKLVMTQSVELPLHGRLAKTTYLKEELVDLWEEIAYEHDLAIDTGVEFTGLRQVGHDFDVETGVGSYRAKFVCLCLGRRGTPRKLGVPGEELPNVVYALIDAAAYTNRNILVVGGGNSAIEAAYALAEQSGNRVSLSYRRSRFTRLKAENEQRLTEAIRNGTIRPILNSNVRQITPDSVMLELADEQRIVRLATDDVFIFAGGTPPFELLGEAGVSFDPSLREPVQDMGPRGTGLRNALGFALMVSLAASIWVTLCSGYYLLPGRQRPDHAWYDALRPTSTIGLSCAALASALILFNFVYLVRRSQLGIRIGTLIRSWLNVHMATGVIALLLLFIHAGMAMRFSAGGLALAGVAILVASGAVGRYLYSWLPKAANGSELEIEAARSRLASLRSEWDHVRRPLGSKIERDLDRVIDDWDDTSGPLGSTIEHDLDRVIDEWDKKQMSPAARIQRELNELFNEAAEAVSLRQRLELLLTARVRRRRLMARLTRVARQEGLGEEQIEQVVGLARKLHDATIAVHNLEDFRSLLASWRFVHLYFAVATILLLVVHVYAALNFSIIG